MGLLDDAIREHLELKRLRGADAGQVAREEHEALGPVQRDEPGADEPAAEHGESAPPGGGPQASGHEFSHVGQETTELDMTTVLAEGSPSGASAPVSGSLPPAQAKLAESGDSLEWEVPRERSDEASEDAAVDGQHEVADEAPVEDVLEETPDFLRETPEQERLWFEQRPPRDFDFDK